MLRRLVLIVVIAATSADVIEARSRTFVVPEGGTLFTREGTTAADYGLRSEEGAGAVARSRSLRNARSKLDKQCLAFVVVSDDFSLERRWCGREQISGSFYV